MNSKQAKLLKYAVEHPQETYTQITAYAGVSEASSNRHCLDELRQMKYVYFWNNPASHPIEVTALGLEALEEYEAKQRAEDRENDKLKALQNQVDELKAHNQTFEASLATMQKQLDMQKQEIEDGKKDQASNRFYTRINTCIAALSFIISVISAVISLFK